MAEATTIITPIPNRTEETLSSSAEATTTMTITSINPVIDSDVSVIQNEMSIETTLSMKEEEESSSSSSSSSSTDCSTTNVTEPPKDDQESSPRALQHLVLAAASDLLDVSPRSMLMETPTSQVGTPYSERKANENATTSETPEAKEDNSKPKGILRKPKYTVTVPIVIDGTGDVSPTTGNTIYNNNHYRKNRNDFDFDFSEIDRMVDNENDDFYSIENSGNTTLLSMLWSLVVLPVILLGYGGLPYLVLACLVWTLIFVARWFRRFLVEEFSMRRNGGLLDSNGMPIPPSVESPFHSKSLAAASGTTNLSGILSSISPIAGARSTKVRFEQGIKFPERKLLRQPIPRIQKPKAKPRNNHKKPTSLFFGSPEEETHSEGDTWSLDSLMVLRNYMKNDNNNNNGVDPTPISVMAPPPPYPPTLSEEEEAALQEKATTPTYDGHSSGDDADDEKDELPELFSSSSDRCRRDSFFPQEVIEEEDTAYESRYGHTASIQLDDDDENDEQPIDDYFHEGLFGKSDSSSPTTSRNRRYRRRKPRDSLCFTFAKKTVVPEGPSIPQCPSDELEYLAEKIQEKFEQAIVIEASSFEPTTEQGSPQALSPVAFHEAEGETQDESVEHEDDADATTTSLTTGSWDSEDASQPLQELSPIIAIDDENAEEEHTDVSSLLAEEDLSDNDDTPDLDDDMKAAFRETEELLSSFVESENIVSHLCLISDEEDESITNDTIEEVCSFDELEEPVAEELSIVNDLKILVDNAAPKPINAELLSADKLVVAASVNVTEQTEPEETSLGTEDEPEEESLPLNEEANACSNNETLQSPALSTYYAEEDLVMDEEHFSTIIDEVLQKNDSKELPILQENVLASDDDFPDFNVMQEISFDEESDDVECILSPHAFKFDDEEPMFRDRDPMAHFTFAKTGITNFDENDKSTSNDLIVHEVHTTPSNLQIEMTVSDVDVECTLSPLASEDTDTNSSESDSDSEDEFLVPTPPKSPENKENLEKNQGFGTQKDKFFVDTSTPAKGLEDMNLPWSPAFPRTVLSPTNQRPTRS